MIRAASPPVRLAAAALALGAACGLGSCLKNDSYVYSAQKYDPAADCVHTYAAVETVRGEGASSVCPRICLSVGEDLYVSTMCPPLPAVASPVDKREPDCAAALTAAAREGTCEEPGDAGDGGEEQDGGKDGGGEPPEAEAPEAGGGDAADDAPPADAAAE